MFDKENKFFWQMLVDVKAEILSEILAAQDQAVSTIWSLCEMGKVSKEGITFVADMVADVTYVRDILFGDNSEPLLCRLDDGIFLTLAL